MLPNEASVRAEFGVILGRRPADCLSLVTPIGLRPDGVDRARARTYAYPMTVRDRLRLLVEGLSEKEAAAALAFVEAHHATPKEPRPGETERLLYELRAEWAVVPSDVSLVDELITERRLEAQREAG